MQTADLKTIMARELRALAREVQAYPDDASVWRTFPGISNSAGTLVLHLAGNLQYYIGTKLGGGGYVRDRQAEFARRDVPRHELLAEIDRALAAVEGTLPRVSDQTLAADFPEPVGGKTLRTGEFLLHLATHLGWHLGQLDYHRRMVTGDRGMIGAIALGELASAR
jgi:hypothetical protein